MAGYRRLISYIYAYEGEEKGKTLVSRSWKQERTVPSEHKCKEDLCRGQ